VLLKMIPEAVSVAWEEIGGQIERAIPESEKTETTMSNLLRMILTGHADCWISYDGENENKVNFIGVTMPVYNELTDEKNLLLYNVTNSEVMDMKTSNRLWLEGFEAYGKYMRANGFKKLVSYFDNERSLKVSKRLGAEIKYYVEFDMTKEG